MSILVTFYLTLKLLLTQFVGNYCAQKHKAHCQRIRKTNPLQPSLCLCCVLKYFCFFSSFFYFVLSFLYGPCCLLTYHSLSSIITLGPKSSHNSVVPSDRYSSFMITCFLRLVVMCSILTCA